MAIDSLGNRLDAMVADSATPANPVDPSQSLVADLPTDPFEQQPDFEPTQVAGLASIAGKVGKAAAAAAKKAGAAVEAGTEKAAQKLQKLAPDAMSESEVGLKADRPMINPADKADDVGPYRVIREAEEEQVANILEQQSTMPGGTTPSPTAKQKEAGVVKGPINTNLITGDVELKQFVESVAKTYGVDDMPPMSFNDLIDKVTKTDYVVSYRGEEIGRFKTEAEALDSLFTESQSRITSNKAFNRDDMVVRQDLPYTEGDLQSFVDPATQTVADPKQLYKLMLAVNDAGTAAFDLGKRVVAAKSDGTLTPDLAMSFKQAVAVEGALLQGLKRKQVDIARSLGIFKMARSAGDQRGPLVEQLLNDVGGIESVHDLAKHYVALDGKSARRNVAAASLRGSVKDAWMSTWINGLLSALPTHALNLSSNTYFTASQIPEMYLASGVGKVRNRLFGGEEAIRLNEANSRAFGLAQGVLDGFVISGKAFIKNEPTDALTKIESVRGGRDAFDIDFGDTQFGNNMNKATRAWGSFVTVPGRALMAEDEFFKALGYRMELNGLAVRAGNTRFDALVKAGTDPDAAMLEAKQLTASILKDPPSDIDNAAKANAAMVTNTRPLEESLQFLEQTRNLKYIGPLLRLHMPFVKTPTNFGLESLARSPLFAISPRFWADWNSGGIGRDKAIAKVTLGSTMIIGASTLATQGLITGAGPFRLSDKKALEGTGWQAFSVSFDNEDMTPELLEKYQKITSVKVGPTKTSISYAGMEPLSLQLAIGATCAEYAMAGPDEETLERCMTGGGIAMYEYIGNQPMMSGIADVVNIFRSQKADGPGLMYDLMVNTVKVGGNYLIGGSPLGAYSSLVASTERVLYPEKSGLGPPNMAARDDATAGAYNAWLSVVNRAASRNPFVSDSVPQSYDSITGELETVGKGNLYELWSPFKTKDGKMPNGYEVLVKYGVPSYDPPRSIGGVVLSQEQINRWKKLATGTEMRIRDPLNGELQTLAQSLQQQAQNPDLAAMWENPSRGRGKAQVQGYLSNVISSRYNAAKDAMIYGMKETNPKTGFPTGRWLVEPDPELADAIEEVARLKDIEGRKR